MPQKGLQFLLMIPTTFPVGFLAASAADIFSYSKTKKLPWNPQWTVNICFVWGRLGFYSEWQKIAFDQYVQDYIFCQLNEIFTALSSSSSPPLSSFSVPSSWSTIEEGATHCSRGNSCTATTSWCTALLRFWRPWRRTCKQENTRYSLRWYFVDVKY